MINLEKEIRQQPNVLASLKEKNQFTLDKLVEQIKENNINNIYFAARGTSDHACVYAQYLFGIVLGIPCTLGTPSVFTQYGKELNFSNTLVIGVSQSGRAEDVNAVLQSANKQGMITVAITNNEDSLIAKTAKFHLFCNANEEKSIAATKTFTSQMYLLALLCARWSENRELSTALSNLPQQVSMALDYLPNQIENIVSSLLEYREAVVLGRGISYPIALEGALKILETNKMKVKGYPISDFYHGPVAQLHNNDLAFVLAQSGTMLQDAKMMLDKLATVGANTVVITDVADICDSKNKIMIENTGCELTMPFIFALAMQIFALKLVIAKGIDPDKSNVIAKITVTK
ncbi:MAG: SIS domain-containing protein [Clostridia bacterium]|nr:SIS domain-containing protein [Clostridia bacterium]MBQ7788155.1 SIS domain-containing protein [Clostridia bacterium]